MWCLLWEQTGWWWFCVLVFSHHATSSSCSCCNAVTRGTTKGTTPTQQQSGSSAKSKMTLLQRLRTTIKERPNVFFHTVLIYLKHKIPKYVYKSKYQWTVSK